jgi:membrane protein YqaA with SNARE-associated domain
MLKRLYGWVLQWAATPYSGWALFLLAVAESSFFPIPPDALLIVLAIAAPKKSFSYAAACTVGSVLGGMVGYRAYDAWAVGIAGFTPIPYKVFTIAAGAFKIHFLVFVLASTISRAARFFLVAAIIRVFGARIRPWIERYFNWLVIVFTILLILGFIVLKKIW